MSGVSPWLRGQRKAELVELAEAAGLEDYEHMKKAELELALDEFLRTHELRLSKHSLFNPFYTSHGSMKSPQKRESKYSVLVAPSSDNESKPIRTRGKRLTRIVQEAATEVAHEVAATISDVAARTPRQSISLQSVPFPPSPATVADIIDDSTAALRSKVGDALDNAGLAEKAEDLRESLSSVVSIEALVLAIEALGLGFEVLPLRYAFTTPAIAGLNFPQWHIHLPDLFQLLTTSFWAPVTLWALTSLFLPLAFAYFFNFALKTETTNARTHHHDSARLTQKFDPLSFNIAKALVTYMVYNRGVRLNGVVGDYSVARVCAGVPGGSQGILIGSGIGVLTTLYEAILHRR